MLSLQISLTSAKAASQTTLMNHQLFLLRKNQVFTLQGLHYSEIKSSSISIRLPRPWWMQEYFLHMLNQLEALPAGTGLTKQDLCPRQGLNSFIYQRMDKVRFLTTTVITMHDNLLVLISCGARDFWHFHVVKISILLGIFVALLCFSLWWNDALYKF